jgi:hypothetical protein
MSLLDCKILIRRKNMPRRKEDRHSVQVLFTTEEYENLKRYAALKNISMSSLVREYTMQGIRGILTQENIDFLTPIIRSQLKSVVDIQADRIAGLVAKTCIQAGGAGAAAYLSAEALNSFVPEKERKSFVEAYDAARKKAVSYIRASDTTENSKKQDI